MKLEKLEPYAFSVVRIGVALVFLWFGTNQIVGLGPNYWTGLVPSYLSGFNPVTLVYIHGSFEIILGLLLLLGLYTRVSSILLIPDLMHTIYLLGYGPIAVRDFGILLALIAISLHRPDILSLDKKIKKK